MHIRCMSTQLRTEISNDLTCEKFMIRVILAVLDDTYLSKQRSDVEHKKTQQMNVIFGNIDAKNFKKTDVESPVRRDP